MEVETWLGALGFLTVAGVALGAQAVKRRRLDAEATWDEALAALEADAGEWEPPEPADRAGYDRVRSRHHSTLDLEGFRVQLEERLYEAVRRDDRGREVVTERLLLGQARLDAPHAPTWARRPWRFPRGDGGAIRMARALLAPTSTHLDDRVICPVVSLDVAEEREASALRLVQGVAALTLEEAALRDWLLGPGGGAARSPTIWAALALSLLTWFPESPEAATQAQASKAAADPELRARARLVLGEARPLLAVAEDPEVPGALRREALVKSLQALVAAEDLGPVEALLAARTHWLQGEGEALAAALVPGADASRASLLLALFERAGHEPRVGWRVFEALAALDLAPDDAATALACPDRRVRRLASARLAARLGDEAVAERCLELLQRLEGENLAAAHQVEDTERAVALLATTGERGGARQLAALGAWAEAVDAAGDPARAVRQAAEAAALQIRGRLPEGLAGALSFVEGGPAGALSEAAPARPGALSEED